MSCGIRRLRCSYAEAPSAGDDESVLVVPVIGMIVFDLLGINGLRAVIDAWEPPAAGRARFVDSQTRGPYA